MSEEEREALRRIQKEKSHQKRKQRFREPPVAGTRRVIEPQREKTYLRVSDQVRNKLGCTAADGYRLEISDLGRRGNVLCSENKGADQLCGNRIANLCLCFHICRKQVFS